MNTIFKTMMTLSIAATTLAATLIGCVAPGDAQQAGDKTYKIGISQFAEHSSLDNCRKGFIEGLAAAGFVEGENVTFDYQNSQADSSISQQIATGFVSAKVDMIAAVATPAAQFAFGAAEASDIPVIYVAVSDPVGAQLVGADGKSGKGVTGVSDLIPAGEQLAMIREFLPDAKTIGILYSTGEVNSEAQLKLYEDAAAEYGFTIEASGVSAAADIALAAEALAAKTDCFTNLTDNTVVSSLATVLDKASNAGIPVFGSEIEQVKNGCLASRGIDYIKLGKQTGAIAARVLNGEDIKTIAYETVTEYNTDVNKTTLAALGITMPTEIEATATIHE